MEEKGRRADSLKFEQIWSQYLWSCLSQVSSVVFKPMSLDLWKLILSPICNSYENRMNLNVVLACFVESEYCLQIIHKVVDLRVCIYRGYPLRIVHVPSSLAASQYSPGFSHFISRSFPDIDRRLSSAKRRWRKLVPHKLPNTSTDRYPIHGDLANGKLW